MYRIKNWRKFQHYKDKQKMLWVKLHLALLNKKEWHELDPMVSKILIMLWLLAGESNGNLPDAATIAFRLRLPQTKIEQALTTLSPEWLECIDTDSRERLDSVYTNSSLDQIRLDQNRSDKTIPPGKPVGNGDFEQFWKAYPRKQGKKAALMAWHKAKDRPEISQILRQLVIQKQSDQWTKDGGQYIPQPATWLNQGRWSDEVEIKTAIASMPVPKPVPLSEQWNRAKNICLSKLQEACASNGDIGRTLSVCRDLYRDLPKYNGEDAVTEAYEIFKYQRSKQQEATK